MPFMRVKGQKHRSEYKETGECIAPSCNQCELAQNQKQRKRREAVELLAQNAGVINNKIFGGDTLKRGQAPWQVTLRGPSLCGGTLIKMNAIISAAHCLDNDSPKNWRIQAGHELRIGFCYFLFTLVYSLVLSG